MLFLNDIYKFKNRTALTTENNEIILYSDLIKKVESFSRKLKERSLIFIICKNNLESIVSYLGSIKSNCVISLIDERVEERSLKKLILDYKPDYIFLEKNRGNKIVNFNSVYSLYGHELIEAKKKTKKKLNDDLALLISTSGSTGSSKLVRQSTFNLENNINSICKYLNITSKDKAITTLPMSYVYGLSIINTHFNQGASIVLNTKSIIEKYFWTSLQKNKVTNFGGVPYTYSMLEKINIKNFNLKNLKYTTQAGGKINKVVAQKIVKTYKQLNIKLYLMYGAAEATARMSYLSWDKINNIESIGKPISGGKFYLEDTRQKIITKNYRQGELIFKGKNVCMGYAKTYKDLSKKDENKGRLKTGDIAYKDKNNFYYIVGRKDRYIKIYGLRINLQELEEIISKYGVDNICMSKKENKINIFIKNTNKIEKLKKYLAALTKLHPSVFEIKIIKKFPLNKNLKISYNSKLLN